MELMTVICLFTIVESLPANQGAINLQEALRGGLLQTTDATAGEAQLWAKFWFIILTALTPGRPGWSLGSPSAGPTGGRLLQINMICSRLESGRSLRRRSANSDITMISSLFLLRVRSHQRISPNGGITPNCGYGLPR